MAPSKMTGKCHNTVIEANGQSRLEVKGLFNLVSAFFLKNAILIQLKFQYSKVWRSIKWTQKHRQHFLMSHYNLSDSKLFFFFFLHVRAGLLIALKITLINFAIFKNKLYNLFYSFFAQSKFWKQAYKDKFLWGHQDENGMLLLKK